MLKELNLDLLRPEMGVLYGDLFIFRNERQMKKCWFQNLNNH